MDAKHVAFTATHGNPTLRLKDCSRWPERQGCGEPCLGQIELSPEDCLVRTILAKWYKGKSCVFLGKPLEEMDYLDHKPSLQIPVCWNCQIAEIFRRRYPKLVVDRPWKRRTLQRNS